MRLSASRTSLHAASWTARATNSAGVGGNSDECVVGFHDIEQAGWSSYNLTTFRKLIDQIADRIVTHLDLSRMVEDSIEVTCFHPVPIWRGSVREPPAAKNV